SNSGNKSSDFSLGINAPKAEFQLGETIEISLKNPKNRQIDSTLYFFEDQFLESTTGTSGINLILKDQRLGNQTLRAMVFSEGETDSIDLSVKIYNDQPPQVYT